MLANWVRCLLVLLQVAWQVGCEGVSFPGPQNYNYAKTYTTQMTGINWQSQSFTVTVPFQAYIHGRMLNTLVVNSTGALLFQYQSSNWFVMKLVYGSDNNMTDLEVFSANKNFTIHYKGLTSSSNVVEWYVTLYDEGANKFLIDIVSNGSKLSALCLPKYCYQDVPKGATLYATCDFSCFSCLQSSCGSQTECPSKCPTCFKTTDTQSSCASVIAIIIAFSVFGGVMFLVVCFLGLHWTGVLKRCCGGCDGCGCCNCRSCRYACQDCCDNCTECCRRIESQKLEEQRAQIEKQERDRKTIAQKIQEKRRQEALEEHNETIKRIQEGGEITAGASMQALTGNHNTAKVADISATKECCICLNRGSDLKTGCGHDFHRHCLDLWMKKSTDCPKCGRAKVLVALMGKPNVK